MSHKIISINPELFKIPNGNRSSKKRKSKDDTSTPNIIFKSQGGRGRNKTTKNAILKFIRENQEKNYKKMIASGETDKTQSVIESPTSIVDKFNGDFEESVKFFETVNKELIEKQSTPAPKNQTLKSKTYVLDDYLNQHDSKFSITDIMTDIPTIFDLPPANVEHTPYSIGGDPHSIKKPLYYKKPDSKMPQWGCMKGGALPTYRQFNRTQRVTPFRISDAQTRPPVSLKSAHEVGSRMENEDWRKIPHQVDKNTVPVPVPVPNNTARPEFNIRGGFRLPERKLPMHSIAKQDAITKHRNKLRYPKQKKTIRRQFQIGKSKIHPKVGVLISNRTIRNHISTQSNLLKQTPIQDVKKYLIRQGFVRIGTSAPNDVLRQMYESAKLMCGEIYNHNPDTLLYNFFNDTDANKPM